MVRSVLALVLMHWAVVAVADGSAVENGSFSSVYDYAGSVMFTVDHDCSTNTVENFPLHIRLKDNTPRGFYYSDLKNGMKDLRFFDSKGRVLDYEVVTWNPKGESMLWVQLPTLRTGATVTMCWNLRDGCTLPEVVSTNVWKNYVGVWHMESEMDSSPNATPGAFTAEAVSRTDGVFGGAYGARRTGRYGPVLATDYFSGLDALSQTGFTASFWIYLRGGTDWAYPFARKNHDKYSGWGLQFCGPNGVEGTSNGLKLHYGVQSGSTKEQCVIKTTDRFVVNTRWQKVDVVMLPGHCQVWIDGQLVGEADSAYELRTGTLGLAIGGLEASDATGYGTLNGDIDEFRLSAGAISRSAILMDMAMATNATFYSAGPVTNDENAVLKNEWKSEPTITKTTWDEGTYPRAEDFTFEPAHGTKYDETVIFYDRATGQEVGRGTGWDYGTAIPRTVGDYRVVITVAEADGWGALEYTIDFRIISGSGGRGLDLGQDRILLMNDDCETSESGKVERQSYSEEKPETLTPEEYEHPYWEHVDANGNPDSSTPASPEDEDDWSVFYEFNLGGGSRHAYWYRQTDEWLWFLDGVRVGNTFNNGRYVVEYGDEGLNEDQNYLPWSYDSQRVIGYTEDYVDGYHRYVGQAVMQNKLNASIVSTCYSNGIGTIYFDAVNGWTDNAYDEDGNALYKLVVEVATQTEPDEFGQVHEPLVQYMSTNPEMGLGAIDPCRHGDWKQMPMRVLRFDDGACTDLGMRSELTLDVTEGGSFGHFFRVCVPVTNVLGHARFRIRRTAIDPYYDYNPDGYAFILIDNVICSAASAPVTLEPYGEWFTDKTGKQVLGCEGAFDPAFPSVMDSAIYGRARATVNGQPVSAGVISSAAMHYRWHYLEQKSTDWQIADLRMGADSSLVSINPLKLPGFVGDIDFWFDANQSGNYYAYADYSGTGYGLAGKYSEEVPSVTNRWSGTDWFVRLRESKSDYSEMKVVIRGVGPIDMYLAEDRLWRGFYPSTNVIAGGIYWRIEPRNKQTSGSTIWNWSTNYWYVMDWDQSSATLPTFPAAGRLSEGGTNSWSRMPYDAQTGYLMFQVDESSLGVTVIRADYQNFNTWNDSKGEYFVGSSDGTGTSSKKGTSASVRTYDQKFSYFPETQATNEDWTLNFNDKEIGDPGYTGYEKFVTTDTYKKAWKLGESEWIYGKYREPRSHVALQMSGSSRGYAEFSDQTMIGENWPRGIEAISLKARVAQSISPAYGIYYDQGGRLKNYTFMARTCFDMKQNKGFAGNASLSLVAYYRASEGAYEARWEQITGKMGTETLYENEIYEPAPRGQRLVISRWDPDGEDFRETVLVAVTNSASFNSQESSAGMGVDMPLMPFDGPATNNLMPFCISVFNENGTNIIVAGIRVAIATPTQLAKGGVSWRKKDWSPDTTDGKWYFAFACDGSDKKLRGGTYGVLSSNCEGMFLTPEFREGATYPGDQTPAALLKAKKGYYSKKSLNSVSGYESCIEDLPWWDGDVARMEAFYDDRALDVEYYDPDNYVCGFTYVPQVQTIDVMTSPMNASTWTKIGEIALTNGVFGTPGRDPDFYQTFYYVNDSKIRLQTGGKRGDYPVDVAINDVILRQWRGYDDWSSKDDETTARQGQYGRTNIVFTTGWVTNGAVRLSARRTKAGTACSVRSPLLDGIDGRGVGLGMIGFTYRKPQENILLKVQIVTNYTWQSGTSLKDMSLTVEEGATGNGSWLTLTNLDYNALMEGYDEKLGIGSWRTGSELGWHGAKGMMRVVIDDELVQSLASETNINRFGEIDILEVTCRDEPALDKGCWWGWNMLTLGDLRDSQNRMFLPDCTTDLAKLGQSLALNNSTSADVSPSESVIDMRKHMPFLQSPTFTNAVIGQVSFKARKYDLSDRAPAGKIVVYGATRNPDELTQDSAWTFIAEFPITNTIYTTYTCKTDSQNFYALRLGVVGVDGTIDPPEETDPNPQRVLIDEVSISEAVRAMLAFCNVGAFRSHLDDTCYVTGATTRAEQPLCNENWGVQAELVATMLGDEIYREFTPRVKLHWYVGAQPWGYANWKSIPADSRTRSRGSAYLSLADGSNLVYRSSYKTSPAAVMPAQSTNVVVQYMLEVEYETLNSTKKGSLPVRATNWLDAVSWTVPDWYAPVDYNSDPNYGAGKTFAGFTILDTVAPGWAWINEMNVFGLRKTGGANSEQTFQFAEICVPAEADLTDWKVRMLDAYLNGKVVTNYVATFGRGKLTGKKQVTEGMKYGKVFRSIGTKEGTGLKYSDGSLDAPWTFSKTTGTFVKGDGYYYIGDYEQPFGVQLVRPSGIIEHSIVVIGTNRWGRLPGTKAYDPTNFVAILNRSVPGSRFFYAGEDCCGEKRTDSVTSGQGESSSVWTNAWLATPGFINRSPDGKYEQKIGEHPSPHGDSIIVYTSVDTSFGHIRYQIGDGEITTEPQMIVLKRGGDVGTNISYFADNWYEIASVKTNEWPMWKYERCKRRVDVTIGVGESNNLYVVGAADIDNDLVTKYGLDANNPYRRAVMAWLEGNSTLYGEFANPGEIHLADYAGLRGDVITNLTLTQMYCLDMDPTVSNLLLQADFTTVGPVYRRGGTLTNDQLTIFMMITNRNEDAEEPVAWSPYVLRGLAPGEHSWQYQNPSWTEETISAWTSETFKVTGILDNGHTSWKNADNWIPLNWFVFHKDSFYQADEYEDEKLIHKRFTAEIEVLDPHCQSSPGADAGWYDWCRRNGFANVFYMWAIDQRLRQVGVQVLTPNNYWNE